MKYSNTQDNNNVISFDQGKKKIEKKREKEKQDLKVEQSIPINDPKNQHIEKEIEKTLFMFINHFESSVQIPEDREQEKIDGLMWALSQVIRSIYYYMENIDYPLQEEIWEAWGMILGDDEFLSRQGVLFD